MIYIVFQITINHYLLHWLFLNIINFRKIRGEKAGNRNKLICFCLFSSMGICISAMKRAAIKIKVLKMCI